MNLTAEEKRAFGQFFRQADTDGVGVVTGEIAVRFFEKTRLDSRILGEVWQLADNENRGFLTPSGFCLALRLIGHAQAGREPTAELALQPGQIPRFEGINPPLPPPPAAPATPSPVLQAQGTGSGPIRIPPLTPEKVSQYAGFFERQALQGDKLPGEQAKQIFEKAGLPNEILGRIWMLADTEQRGSLVQAEFVIAMHLLYSFKTGALRGLPNIIPAPLYEAAQRRGLGGSSPVIPRQQSPISTTPPVSAVPRQFTGQGPLSAMRTGSPLGRPPLAAQTTGDWLITAADKERFDKIYEELDKGGRGFITGEEAVNFFSSSNLSEEVLAQIWDLADIRSEGRLNKDEFAVAMYLIRQQRTKSGGANTLPAALPPNLIPPSMRGQVRSPPPPAAASIFDPPPPPKAPSALDDLFGLDDPPPAAQPQVALATGSSSVNDPFASSVSPPMPSSPVRPTASSTFKPFVPSSSFGRGLTTQVTGGSSSSASGYAAKPPTIPTAIEGDLLLGDNDAEVSQSLGSDSTELANLSNQIGSLTKQMQDVQGQRVTTQNALNQTNAQKKNFEERLSQLRTLYEKEAKDVRGLEQQLTASRNETQKLMADMATIDSTFQDLKGQHQQTLTALRADQQENTNLKERIRTVNAEISELRPQIEKLKSEARQQKGLAAINKKQLATTEGERDKLKTEVDDLTKSAEELSRQVSSSSPPPAQMSSPTLSVASVNNPFFRRTGSTDILGTFASPSTSTFNDKSFDDVFGPSAAPSSTPPPPVSAIFKPQTTGTSTGSAGSFATPASATPNFSRPGTLPTGLPPPPESREATPNLPFADAVESLSSSRQVSPPLSRLGQTDTPTPFPVSDSPVAPAEPATSLSRSGTGLSAHEPAEDSKATPAAVEDIFNVAASGNTNGDASRSPDPFGAMDQAKAKEDFDSAFASFRSAKVNNQKAGPSNESAASALSLSAFETEFPPIAELERDDTSESDSEHGGFDDDFAPVSPPAKKVQHTSEAPPSLFPTEPQGQLATAPKEPAPR